MKKETLLALLDTIFDDKISQIKNELVPIKGERGLRGPRGRSFEFESHKDDIFSLIKSYIDETKDQYRLKFEDLSDDEIEELKIDPKEVEIFINFYLDSRFDDLKLKFSDLTEEEKETLKVRGPRGQKGKPGKDFVFEDYAEKIKELLPKEEDLKLRFSDLTEEEVEEIKLKFSDLSEEEKEQLTVRGPRGQRGKPGKDFIFEEHAEKITELLPSKEDLKLNYSDLSNEEKEELKLKFENLTDEEKAQLKLKFSDLTDEEITSLKVRGPRGLKGKSIKGEDGATWLPKKEKTAKHGDMFLDKKTFNIYRFEDKWKLLTNIKGRDGLPGLPGVVGRTGRDGVDGIDAPKIVDVRLEKIGESTIYFVFYFDDGSAIETDRLELPETSQAMAVFNSFSSTSSGDSVEVAKRLQVTRVADEDIEIGEFVTATSGTNVALAQSDEEVKADVLGMAITQASTGEDVTVLLFGNDENVSYAYALNAPLYLALDGLISTTPPASGWITRVATSNGTGSIFIKVEEPIEI